MELMSDTEFQEIPGEGEGTLKFWTTQKPGTKSFAQRVEVVAWLTGAFFIHESRYELTSA